MADKIVPAPPDEEPRPVVAPVPAGSRSAVVVTQRIADRGDGQPGEVGQVIVASPDARESWIKGHRARKATPEDVAMAEPRVVRLTEGG